MLQLYVDIEHTSRSNAFYEKYNLRYSMGELLRAPIHTCSGPRHRDIAFSSCLNRFAGENIDKGVLLGRHAAHGTSTWHLAIVPDISSNPAALTGRQVSSK